MSRENVELCERVFAHFIATGEPEWGSLAEEIEVLDHDTPDQGLYRGHAGFRRWLEEWGSAWSDYSIEVEEFIDAGDLVVAVFRMRASGLRSGASIERQDAALVTMRDGSWLRLDYFNNKAEAVQAAGLPR